MISHHLDSLHDKGEALKFAVIIFLFFGQDNFFKFSQRKISSELN
jgi:hypothetical protein